MDGQGQGNNGGTGASERTGDWTVDRMSLDWLTLRFLKQDSALERPFLDYYSFRSINYTRFALLAAMLMIAAFGVLDYFLLPNNTKSWIREVLRSVSNRVLICSMAGASRPI